VRSLGMRALRVRGRRIWISGASGLESSSVGALVGARSATVVKGHAIARHRLPKISHPSICIIGTDSPRAAAVSEAEEICSQYVISHPSPRSWVGQIEQRRLERRDFDEMWITGRDVADKITI
jgi:hypothetical protein